MPTLPSSHTIDVNDDNIFDYSIEYIIGGDDDNSCSAWVIIGSIVPNDNNQILYRPHDGHLFFGRNDTVKINETHDDFWSGYRADLVSIYRNEDCLWDENWRIGSLRDSNYYIASILQVDSSSFLGWIKLNISIETGEIDIVDYEFSNSEELIIKR